MRPLIRRAQPGDAPEVAELLVELGYPENEAVGVRRRIELWAGVPDGDVLVAELDGRVVGVIAVAVVPYFERSGHWARLVALVVGADVRRRGIARRLVAAAEEIAAERGCIAVEVTSARRRSESHAFYASLGYADRCGQSARYMKELAGL
ncbi:MAG TPA: GNAT family N-acetyltransferase [Gaiellales bacterium]|jgi:GNAT superfamily N-acetyltransferase|nr:GNAT family N-acetyltransferase [Gaiellales bacterium]